MVSTEVSLGPCYRGVSERGVSMDSTEVVV